MRKNLFLAFEGIDGSGKSTQLKLLCHRLKEAGQKVYPTFEPTDGPIGAMIRDIFNHRMEADDRTIAGLFVADRLDHLLHKSHGMLKKMTEGYTVITDRYYFSSYAYHGTHMPMDWVIASNALSAELLRPDLNIYLDITPEQSMQRLSGRQTAIERYETLDNLRNVRNKYLEAFDKLRLEEKVFIVDANQTEDQIAHVIWNEISRLFGFE